MRGTPWQQFDEAEKSAVTPCVTQARDIPCQKPHAQHQSAKKVLTETGLKADVPTSAEIDALRAAAQPAVRAAPEADIGADIGAEQVQALIAATAN